MWIRTTVVLSLEWNSPAVRTLGKREGVSTAPVASYVSLTAALQFGDRIQCQVRHAVAEWLLSNGGTCIIAKSYVGIFEVLTVVLLRI
jgi:hypothetical protein